MIEAAWLSQVAIRPGGEQDLEALEWRGELVHFRRLFWQAYQQTCEGRAAIWVAELASAGIIGQVFVQFDSRRKELADGHSRAYLYGFRVQAAYRNGGVGSQLLGQVEQDLQSRHFRWITLNVGRKNLAAQRFYRRYGYQVVAPEAGRWHYTDHLGARCEVNEPAWRMQKTLPQPPTG